MSLINDMLKDINRHDEQEPRSAAVSRPLHPGAAESTKAIPKTPGGFDDMVLYNPYTSTGSAGYSTATDRMKSHLPTRYAVLVGAGLLLAVVLHFGLKENQGIAGTLIKNDPIYAVAQKAYAAAYSMFLPEEQLALSKPTVVSAAEVITLPKVIDTRGGVASPTLVRGGSISTEPSRVSGLLNSSLSLLLQQDDIKRALPTNMPQLTAELHQEPTAFMDKGASGSMSNLTRTDDRQISEAIEDANQYLRVGAEAEAEAVIQKMLALHPVNHPLRGALINVLTAQGNYAQAHKEVAIGLKVYPEDMEYRYLEAKAYAAEGNVTAGITTLLASPPQIEEYPEHYGLLAALYQRQEQHTLATQIYWDLVEIFPEGSRWWVGLAISLESSGATQLALDNYLHALSAGGLQPDLRAFVNNRVKQLANRSDTVISDTSSLGLATR